MYSSKSLINCMVFNAISNGISVILWQPVHLPVLSWNLYLAKHSFQATGYFLTYHCRNNGQRSEKNGSYRNDYHQTSEMILAETEIKLATSCSQVLCATDGPMGLASPNQKTFLDAKTSSLLFPYNFGYTNPWSAVHYYSCFCGQSRYISGSTKPAAWFLIFTVHFREM